MKRVYIRDGRSPVPLKESTSRVMSANKAKNTKPELILRKALWEKGIKGYRLNWEKAPGRPDIVFLARKIAIFVQGCYWHRCPNCLPSFPKSHKDFWERKFNANIQRDNIKVLQLEQMGWRVLILWECQIEKDLQGSLTKIKGLLF